MGKLVTFWSPVKGQAKVTASLCAVASALGMMYPEITIAVTSVCGRGTDLEDRMDEKIGWVRKKELYDRSGMAALLANCKQSTPNKETIKRCALPLLFHSVVLFPGLSREMKLIHGKNMEELEYYVITEKLTGEYDITLVDLESEEREKAVRYMKTASLSVVVLPQNPAVWKQYREICREIKGNKVMLLLGGYLRHSRYGLAALRGSFFGELSMEIGAIPLNTGFMDAMAEGRTMEFFLRNEKVRKKEENYEFMVETKRTAEKIRKCLYVRRFADSDLSGVD